MRLKQTKIFAKFDWLVGFPHSDLRLQWRATHWSRRWGRGPQLPGPTPGKTGCCRVDVAHRRRCSCAWTGRNLPPPPPAGTAASAAAHTFTAKTNTKFKKVDEDATNVCFVFTSQHCVWVLMLQYTTFKKKKGVLTAAYCFKRINK